MDNKREKLFAALMAGWILTGCYGAVFAQQISPELNASASRYSRAETLDLQIEIERLRKAFEFFREDRELALEELSQLERRNTRLQEQVDKLEAALKKKEKREKPGGLIGKLMAPESGGDELDALKEELNRERRMRRHYEAQVREMDLALAKFRQERVGVAESIPEMTEPVPPPEAVKPSRKEPPAEKPSTVVRTAAAEPFPAPAVREEKIQPVPVEEKAEAARDEDALMANGEKLLGEGRVEEALAVFSVLLEQNPSNARAMMGLASCYYNIWDFKNAESILNQLLDIHPTYAEAMGLKGMISWRNNDLEKADRYLSRGLLLDAKSAQLHNYMGIVHHSRQKLQEAAKEFRQAVDLDPRHAEAQFNLAVVLATSSPSDITSARKYYESAISLGSERNQDLEKILYP